MYHFRHCFSSTFDSFLSLPLQRMSVDKKKNFRIPMQNHLLAFYYFLKMIKSVTVRVDKNTCNACTPHGLTEPYRLGNATIVATLRACPPWPEHGHGEAVHCWLETIEARARGPTGSPRRRTHHAHR
jgi:hypothetical protein